jgi:hypothetical protein
LEARAYEWFTAAIGGMGREKGLTYMRALATQRPALRIVERFWRSWLPPANLMEL